MALTDKELLDAALIDLNLNEKRRLQALLREELLKVNDKLKKRKSSPKDFITTGTGVQPSGEKISTTGALSSFSGDLQEEKDKLTRQLVQVEASLGPRATALRREAPGVTPDSSAAYGGIKYVLKGAEEDGIVQLFQPGSTDQEVNPAVNTGYLLGQQEDRAKPKAPGEQRTISSTRIVDPERFLQKIYNEYTNDPQAVIAEKKRLIAVGELPAGTVVDGDANLAFRNAMGRVAAKISGENYRRIQADPKATLLTLDNGLEYFISRGTADGSTTRTQTSISTKDEAYATLNAALRSYLGREATEEELSQFTAQLNTFERKSPTVSTTTGTGTVISGGTEGASERMATEFARSQEGSAAFRAGTYYYDALLDAIDNPLF